MWLLEAIHVDGTNSFIGGLLLYPGLLTGTPSCPTPLSITILPRVGTQYNGLYVRDLAVYGSGMHPALL